MRCNPLRWLLGVVLVAGLLGVMNLKGVLARIESELEQRSRTALEQAGMGWAEVVFSGRDGWLSGKAADEKEQRQAYDITTSVWGVRAVRNRTELVEEQANYVWAAVLRENRLRLIGYVPNETTRQAIIGAAKATFPQLEIDDRMKRARGAPETELWLGAVSFGLKQLSGLKAGARVDLDAGGLTVAGEAESFAAYRGIKSAMSSMPQGLKLKGDNVVPPVAKPYVWTARFSANQLQLGGFVPSERAREEVFAAAQKAFARKVVVDRMQIASGEPEDMLAAAAGALHKLSQLEEGAVELKDKQLLLSGLAAKQETAEALRDSLSAGMPDSFRVTEQIQFREPTIKPVSPYTIGALIDGETVLLTGFVPSEPARAALANATQSRFPGRKVSDELQLGAGAPDGWQACMVAGMAGLARLGNGRIDMVDRTLRFAAVTDDEDVAEAIRGELRAAANRACELDVRIVVDVPPEPELNWRAATSEGEVLLEGEVPDESTRSHLALAAARLFPDARLVDRMEVKGASSKKWPKVTETGLKLLARLRSGEVRLAGLELTVSGQAPNTAVATVVRQQLRELPKGYKGRDVVEVRSDAMIWAEQEARRKAEAEARRKAEEEEARRKAEEDARRKAEDEARRRQEEEDRQKAEAEARRLAAAAQAAREAEALAAEEARRAAEAAAKAEPAAAPEGERDAGLAPEQPSGPDRCQEAIADATLHGTVSFDRGSATLHQAAKQTLSKVLAVAAACPQVQIEVQGHTDAEGTPDRNQVLSERRAEAVVEFLIDNGVPAGKIKAVGYGATRPVAPNDSADSRAMNRRIEFIVKSH